MCGKLVYGEKEREEKRGEIHWTNTLYSTFKQANLRTILLSSMFSNQAAQDGLRLFSIFRELGRNGKKIN